MSSERMRDVLSATLKTIRVENSELQNMPLNGPHDPMTPVAVIDGYPYKLIGRDGSICTLQEITSQELANLVRDYQRKARTS